MPFTTAQLSAGPAAQAAANSLEFTPQAPASSFTGALFDYLQEATVTERYSAASAPLFEIGTITGRVGGSQSRQQGAWTVTTSYNSTEVRTYGYLAMQLERAVPQLVLDSKKNGSSIPMPIGGGQTLALEGDFNSHFTLYCPTGYERDALYIFTPDLMALLIDETGDLDVEIVDDMLFVYSTEAFDLSNAGVWQRLGRIRDTVGAKALSQTDYYADDRVADRAANVISDDGRRLTQGFLGGTGTRLAAIVIGGFALVIAVIAAVAFFVLQAVL